MLSRGFMDPLTDSQAAELKRRATRARGSALTATTVAGSGHPGGSLSSMEILTVVYGCARLRPDEPGWDARDRIVVSHGHVSPGVYSALAEAGFFDPRDVEAHFRQAGSPFEGHVERGVPGVDWASGNLGQGLSAGVGFALASRLTGTPWRTYVLMSDGEQMKGQVGEARRLAVDQGLEDLCVVVDLNGIQISGATSDVMPVRVREGFEADGWRVLETDGHDVSAIHQALLEAWCLKGAPVAVLARTVIGKGVSFMEGRAEFHGRALSEGEYSDAMFELGLEPRLEEARAARAGSPGRFPSAPVALRPPAVDAGAPREHGGSGATDCRTAWGAALVDLAVASPDVPMAVLDCDLASSVKTSGFAEVRPSGFIQCGVGEHNAATVAGALSISGVLTFWADFGVFAIDEAYNQQRLNEINHTSVKLVATHCGLDVGEDGKTHQCLDHVGAFRNLPGWRVVSPADPDQTDRAVRWAAAETGNVAIVMGRSRVPPVLDATGGPLFGAGYRFEYGRIAWAREGTDACLLAAGGPVGQAVAASDLLREEGHEVAVGVVACPLTVSEQDMRAAVDSGLVVTVEDHWSTTGLGATVALWMSAHPTGARLLRLGVTAFSGSGAAADLLAAAGIDSAGIAASLREALRAPGR